MNTTAEAVSPLSLVRQSYAVRFTTPAFLGDVGQNGYWRTPPLPCSVSKELQDALGQTNRNWINE